jgi:outer membrane protein OmpA-like peptidoglycan-associated protein
MAYRQGNLVDTYEVDYAQAVAAGRDTLAALRIPVSDTIADELKTTLYAVRPDHTPVEIEVVRLEPGRTQVGVRTGHIGVADLNTSTRIQQRIRLHLARTSQGAAVPARQPVPREEPATVRAEPDPGRRARPTPVVVYFESGSNELRSGEQAKLDRLASTLSAQPHATITLNGFADGSGPADFNRMVSESRASTVKMYLVGKGVEAQRIRVVGHGAQRFAAADTGSGRQLNRRVEVAVDAR